MRALELLGKISDVGLFTEKSEVTITHQTTDDIKEKLRAKLAKIVNPEEEIEDAVVLDGEPLDVDSILNEFDDD
jgi:predicted nucleotide-binding protein (sugar kinase/HSP70/actin superfamily)